MSDGGKGSSRRNEDSAKVRDNWDRIFGVKKDSERYKGKPLKEEPLKDTDND